MRILSVTLFLILSILAVRVATSTSSTVGDFFPFKSECRGSISDCAVEDGGELLLDESEFDLDTEINMRMLAYKQYISYGALRRNSVPCSRRGASYYNCRAGGQANPYSRGCSTITRCRR